MRRHRLWLQGTACSYRSGAGTGALRMLPGPITYDVMAQDTIAFMETIGVPSAHLVGWSDGALVALLVALRRRTSFVSWS